jgi:transcriptional/translational regulatory protein YebC/TACO1
MAEAGSVLFNFERKGVVAVSGVSEETAFDAAVECGADDVVHLRDDEGHRIGFKMLTDVAGFGSVRDQLQGMDLTIVEEESGLVYEPLVLVDIDNDDQYASNENIYHRCLELDDVDSIFTTCADVGRNKGLL